MTLPARSPEALGNILSSLDVEHASRFQPEELGGKRRTKCNWLVEDACGLLGVHLPKGLLAREQLAWLDSADGRRAGWFECAKAVSGEHVALGRPAIVGWTNPDPNVSSHVAMLRSPGRICQAGSSNYNDAPLVNGFGARQVRYFVHL